jgi:hypothetical protein
MSGSDCAFIDEGLESFSAGRELDLDPGSKHDRQTMALLHTIHNPLARKRRFVTIAINGFRNVGQTSPRALVSTTVAGACSPFPFCLTTT